MYSPQDVHFILKGAMRRTVISFGPVGRRCLGVRVIFEGSKSGGKYFVRTFRSDMAADLVASRKGNDRFQVRAEAVLY